MKSCPRLSARPHFHFSLLHLIWKILPFEFASTEQYKEFGLFVTSIASQTRSKADSLRVNESRKKGKGEYEEKWRPEKDDLLSDDKGSYMYVRVRCTRLVWPARLKRLMYYLFHIKFFMGTVLPQSNVTFCKWCCEENNSDKAQVHLFHRLPLLPPVNCDMDLIHHSLAISSLLVSTCPIWGLYVTLMD